MNTESIDLSATLVNVALHLKPRVKHGGTNIRDQALFALAGAAEVIHMASRFEQLSRRDRDDLIDLYLTCCGHDNVQATVGKLMKEVGLV